MESWIQNVDSYRQAEKMHIMSLIEPGTVIQVCGPPMVGKSTIVYQVVKDMCVKRQRSTIFYHIICKNLDNMTDLCRAIMVTLNNVQLPIDDSKSFTMNDVLFTVQSTVSQRPDRNHVFIFHKCEGLHSPQSNFLFLTFISNVIDLHVSRDLKVSVVMTTYKKFQISGRYTKCADVGMLTDPIDIHCLLRHHAPGVNVIDHVYVCQTALCLPEAVILLCQRYLSDRDNVQSLRLLQSKYPGSLEEIISWDEEFFYQLFNARTDDVKSWMSQKDIELLASIGQSSFTEGQLCTCFRNLYPDESHTSWRFKLTKLKESYVIREVHETGQLAVHPLVVYYIHMHWPRARMYFTDEDVSSSNKFMPHVIKKTEENMRKHGRKGQLYGCHVKEWPVIQRLLQAAIHCPSYKTFLKVAVMGRNLITACYPNESRQFYSTLYHSAKMIGSPSHVAVMEICLAQAIASSKEVDWSLAISHLDSAITTLKNQGPNFFYKTALRKKAQFLEKLGDHLQSLEFFQKAKEESACQGFIETDDTLYVTELQKEEDDITSEIQEIIPLIFTGNNTAAKEKLMELFHDIPERYENHPDYAVVLNGIGLTIQRGTKDMSEAFFWYNKSYLERKHMERICPQSMLPTMNNMAMILCRKGNPYEGEKFLQKSLAILRENGWNQYYTALTLTHMSEVKVKQNDFRAAFDVTLQADHIIQKTTQNHDFRLKINMSLVHHRLVLGHSQPNPSKSVEDYINTLIDLGGKAKNYLSDDGHHYLMSAYEHGLFLHLKNSEDKFNNYKRNVFAHIEENQFLEDVLLRKNLTKSPSSLLSEHREFLEYLTHTEYKDYNYETFLSFILKSCPMCRNIRDVCDISVWSKEIDHLNEMRRKRLKDVVLEFPMLSDFTPISSNLSDVKNCPDISSSDKLENVSHPHVNSPSVVDNIENISSPYVNSPSVIDRVENISSPYMNSPSVIDKVENISSPYMDSPSVIDKVENISSPYVNSSSVIDRVENISSPYVNSPSVIDKVENISSPYVNSSSVIDRVENISSPYVNSPSVIDRVENISSPYKNSPSVIDRVENISSPYVNSSSVIDRVENISSPYMNSPSVIDKVENISSYYWNNPSVDDRNVSLSSPHVNNPSDIDKAENVSNHLANYPSDIQQTDVLYSPQVKNPSTTHVTREILPQSFNDTPTPDISWAVVDPSDDDSVPRSMNLEVINLSQCAYMGELSHLDVFTFSHSPQTSDFSELLPPLLLRQLTEESSESITIEKNFNNSEGFDLCELSEQFTSLSLDKSDDLCKFVSEMSHANDDVTNPTEDGEPEFEIGAYIVNTSTHRSLTFNSQFDTHTDDSEHSIQCKTCPGDYSTQCKTCLGENITQCKTCLGEHSIHCKTCPGENITQCKTCLGENITQCKTCLGENITQCKTCLGENITQCKTCLGENITQCKTCLGEHSIHCKTCPGDHSTQCKTCLGDNITQCKTCYHMSESLPVLQEKTDNDPQVSPTSLSSDPVYSLKSDE